MTLLAKIVDFQSQHKKTGALQEAAAKMHRSESETNVFY